MRYVRVRISGEQRASVLMLCRIVAIEIRHRRRFPPFFHSVRRSRSELSLKRYFIRRTWRLAEVFVFNANVNKLIRGDCEISEIKPIAVSVSNETLVQPWSFSKSSGPRIITIRQIQKQAEQNQEESKNNFNNGFPRFNLLSEQSSPLPPVWPYQCLYPLAACATIVEVSAGLGLCFHQSNSRPCSNILGADRAVSSHRGSSRLPRRCSIRLKQVITPKR